MEKFLLGLMLVFVKTNLYFVDMGVFYYATNILGYGLMYLGVRDLKAGNEQMGKVQPLVLVMIFHSVFFLVLNSTGYSIPFSTGVEFALVMSLLALGAAGMIMIPFILSAFISAISSRLSSVARLERLVGIMLGSMILASILFLTLTTLTSLAYISMGLVLLVQLLFVYRLYKTMKEEDLLANNAVVHE